VISPDRLQVTLGVYGVEANPSLQKAQAAFAR